jgi:hypothetical protein
MEFKIGNWVYIGSALKQITELYYDVDGKINAIFCGHSHYNTQRDIIIWKPTKDEYCWNTERRALGYIKEITNEEHGSNYYFLTNINGIESYGAYTVDRFEPFIGELPSFLKD